MKSLTLIFLIVFSCSSMAGNEISTVGKKQRKLVSRYHEALELLPNRCPESAREDYRQAVVRFEKAYPEFIELIRDSDFRPYAIKNFSKNTSSISQDACLFFKDALDKEVDTEKGQKEMSENTGIMRVNG